METNIGENKYKVGAAVFAIMSLVLSASLIGQPNVYYCEDRQIAMQCDKLSSGIGTRCYFNDGIKDTYKVCKLGWVKFEEQQKINIENISKEDFICNNNTLIKECKNGDNQLILRVGLN